MMNSNPPIGVIAPNIVILVTERVYKDPEKITIPLKNKIKAVLILFGSNLSANTPQRIIAKLWKN